jgi:hypothetical protein
MIIVKGRLIAEKRMLNFSKISLAATIFLLTKRTHFPCQDQKFHVSIEFLVEIVPLDPHNRWSASSINDFHFFLSIFQFQIEFAYPPLVTTPNSNNPSDEPVCPSGWKYLPTLALPDGSHNFYKDSAFFNIPSLTDPQKSIYGVSCFRQIAVEVSH